MGPGIRWIYAATAVLVIADMCMSCAGYITADMASINDVAAIVRLTGALLYVVFMSAAAYRYGASRGVATTAILVLQCAAFQAVCLNISFAAFYQSTPLTIIGFCVAIDIALGLMIFVIKNRWEHYKTSQHLVM